MSEQQRKKAHEVIEKLASIAEETLRANKGVRVSIKEEMFPTSVTHSIGGASHDYATATVTISFSIE